MPNAFARTTRQRSGDKEAGMRERGCEREREREVVQRENEKGREERKDGVIKTSTVFLVALYRTRY